MKLIDNIKKFKFFYIILVFAASFLAYADFTGWRLLSFTNQKTWSATGPSGHK